MTVSVDVVFKEALSRMKKKSVCIILVMYGNRWSYCNDQFKMEFIMIFTPLFLFATLQKSE